MGVDWDGACGQLPQFERATYPLLWAQLDGGGYDPDRVRSFMNGYCDAGGTLLRSDANALWIWLTNLLWWTEQNALMAIRFDSAEQDANAVSLLRASLAGETTVRERQQLFLDCL